MGMDISGKNPIVESGEYFRASCWSWRPLQFLCEFADNKFNLGIDFSYWAYNDGAGLQNDTECNKLADALERILVNNTENLKDDDDIIGLCLGLWVHTNTGSFVDGASDGRSKLNRDYPKGTILYGSVVDSKGQLVQPAHSITLGHIKEFITFLRTSGGFEIW